MDSRNPFGNKINHKDYKKFSKNPTSFLFSNPVFFIEIIVKNKRDLELVTSPFKVAEYVPKFSFYSDSWPGHVWCFNSKRFFSYSKNYSW